MDFVNSTEWYTEALAGNRFETWFQPIVDTSDNSVLGHECLVRLCVPESGGQRTYGAGEIFGAARSRGETSAFDTYSRQLAVRSAARQSRWGRYFVNLMASQESEQRMSHTGDLLRNAGMRPGSVVFEAVEWNLVRNPKYLRRLADDCRAHQFSFALDNVGAISRGAMDADALRLVCDLRPDFIKLDMTLAQNIEEPVYGATVRKLVELADRFGGQVIATGVERQRTVENFWLLGVETMQGYFFGSPAPNVVRPGAFEKGPFVHGNTRGNTRGLELVCSNPAPVFANLN